MQWVVRRNILTLTVIVPFYNEEKTLESSLIRLKDSKIADEVILIDDCSTDNSLNIAQSFTNNKDWKLYRNENNLGKGSAIQKALDFINSDLFIVHDADLEYNPLDIIELKNYHKNHQNIVVIGSRFLDSKVRVNKYFRTKIANKFLSFLFSKVNKVHCTDVATCYKLFESKHLSKIKIVENDFSIEVEILSKFLNLGLTLKEHPISYKGRTYEEGKKIGLSDGLKYIYTIFKYRFRN